MAEDDDAPSDPSSDGSVRQGGGRKPIDTPQLPERRRRPRITLSFQAGPLLLPDEPTPDGPPVPKVGESSELTLPGGHRNSETPAQAPLGDEREVALGDGWQRERPNLPRRPSSRPPRPPSTAPGRMVPDDSLAEDALDLVNQRSRPSSPGIDLVVEMTERYVLDDYTTALRLAELILGGNPTHPEALGVAQGCRKKLVQLYRSRLSPMARRPTVAVQGAQVRWLGLDHRAGFLLSRVTGDLSLDELIEVGGMPLLESLKILVELLDMGAFSFEA